MKVETGEQRRTKKMADLWLAGWIAGALLAYLIYALLKPEEF